MNEKSAAKAVTVPALVRVPLYLVLASAIGASWLAATGCLAFGGADLRAAVPAVVGWSLLSRWAVFRCERLFGIAG